MATAPVNLIIKPYDAIPQDLREQDIWLRWNLEERDGKTTKIPYRADGRGCAKTNDSSTWSTFEAAVSSDIGSGLGCVVKNEYVVIDLDKVINPTGEVEQWALDIVEELQSYTEISPSGTGLHIWVKGQLPEGGNRRGRMEMYDQKSPRYMTVSAHVFHNLTEIREVDLTDLHRRMVEGADPQYKTTVNPADGVKKTGSPKELKEELSKGNWQSYYDSQSQADLAYCRVIAPECYNDRVRIDAAFRASKLMRPKWDERRGDQTYGEMTLTKALSGIVSVSTSQLVMTRLSSMKPEAIEWLWPDKIPFGKLSLFVGNPGLGKSFVSIDIAARASRGLNWADSKNTVEPLETILVSSEDDPNDTILPRCIAAGADTSKIHYVKCARDTDHGGVSVRGFSIDKDLPALQAALKAYPDVRLVIIDPLANHLGDANLNREQEVRKVLTPLASLARDYNVAVIVVTHFNKAMSVDTAHKVGGAVAVVGVVRVAWAFVKNPENSEERMMLNMKANISNGARGMSYTVESKEIEHEGKPIRTAVVKWGGATTANLEETMEMNTEDKKIARAVKWLQSYMGDDEKYARDAYKAGDARGFDEQTLRRAYRKLGGKPEQTKNGWVWRLPVEEKPPADSQPNPSTVADDELSW